MNTDGIEPSNTTCVEVVQRYIKSRLFRQAIDIVHDVKEMKFHHAFSPYTTLIGSLAEAHESSETISLLKQMQEVV